MATSSTLLAQHWDALVQKHILRAKKRQARDLMMQAPTFESFNTRLQRMNDSQRNARVAKCLTRLEPSLQHLEVFTSAINNCVQAKAEPAALVWGVTLGLVSMAMHYVSTLETLTSMLEELTANISRFNRYVDLLPENADLQRYLVLLYDDYVGFCIDAVNFYDRRSWYNVLVATWSTVKESFDKRAASIAKHVQQFEHEARTNIDGITVKGFQDIKAQLTPFRTQSVSPSVVFEVPLSRNNFFVGRGRELTDLHAKLHPPAIPTAQHRGTCVIHSMGGVGKTQLALEYAYSHQKHYNFVFWFNAETGPELASQFASLSKYAPKEHQTGIAHTSQLQDIQKAKDWLQSVDKSWLLIYDNTESWETIKPYWPPGLKGSIILTSQNSELNQISGGSEISLEPLNPQDGAHLLLRHLRSLDINTSRDMLQQAADISASLGGLPIAIAHMAGYIDKTQSSLEEFSELYARRQHSRKIWSQNCRASTYQYDHRLDQVWTIALDRLPDDSRLMMRILSMFGPDRIPEGMLFTEQQTAEPDLRSKDMIYTLRDRQLVRRDMVYTRPFWSVHRALQLNVLHDLDSDPVLRQDIFEHCVSILRKANPRQSEIQAPSNEHWRDEEECLPHILHLQTVFEQSDPPMIATPDFAELLGDVGNYLWERALYEKGLKCLELAEHLYEDNNWNNPMAHSKILTILGVMSNEVGISGRKKGTDRCFKSLQRRQQHMEQCFEAKLEIPECDYLLLGNAWNDIACSMLEHSSYAQAEGYLIEAIEIKRRLRLDEEGLAYFNYAENFKNLALTRMAQGSTKAARRLADRAAYLIEKGAGRDTAVAQAFRFHLAYAMFADGDLDASFQLHQDVASARSKIFGEKGVHSLNSMYACSVLLQALGRIEEAEKLLLKSLSETDTDWPQECRTRAKYRLATVYRQQHRIAEAVALENEVEDEDSRIPGNRAIIEVQQGDKMAYYDHLVSFEAGRSTVGRLRVEAVITDVLAPPNQISTRQAKP